MDHRTLEEQLLAAPHLIACIHEDDVESQFGITILYSEGTSFWKPLKSKEEQKEVWETILKIRPNRLAQFDDVLFDPANVREVGLIENIDGGTDLCISFVNQRYFNDLFFPSNDCTNFESAVIELMEFLSNYQESRANVFFVNTTLH